VLEYDDPAFAELTDPRARLVIDVLSRNIPGEEIWGTLSRAGLNPGDYPYRTPSLTWTTAVPDAARIGRLSVLVGIIAETRPAVVRELERRIAEALRPAAGEGAGWYRQDDPYACSFVGLRSARAVIDRAGLRSGLRQLADDQYWVLVVNGLPRSGKSHTWLFIDHLRSAGRLVGINQFTRVTTHRWSGEVTGEAIARSLADKLQLPIDLSPSGELDDALVRKFLDRIVPAYRGGEGITRWIILDGLDRPGVQEGARDLVRGLIGLVEEGELRQTRLVVTGLDTLGLSVGYAVRTEDIPAIDRTVMRAFLTDVAQHLGREITGKELDEWTMEILGSGVKTRDLSDIEASVVRLVTTHWAPKAAEQ
jgi:hypothetical protein